MKYFRPHIELSARKKAIAELSGKILSKSISTRTNKKSFNQTQTV